ncbi:MULTISPECIES: DNA-binding transcriptional regulator CsiR [Modicisalibacter]|uniref:DNA-binding transcriptional regulator CsiR n=1 Tax=Modicisalibacter TaxID=574347 RepID=UPI00100B950A|nr:MULTISPECIES: DNA-binding transcriptional regulator CsiR [Halomonadaceae]MBZ9560256.1 DNA-binding transcriptional regulator CsiR [Modicisalibacter sp. R2A 31.J]MBZ9576165.1 DNA-binding transcriptional regulator CsiR [Modicisalibacter sp. MOD 31.J]
MTRDVPRPNLAISAHQRLKRDIIRGVFAPGEKLLMSRLKARYELGVGPLREALSQLIGERLVTAVSQRGYRVAGMSLQELEDVYDARAELEGLVLELAIARGDDDWEAQILARAHTLAKVMEVNSAEEMLDVWDARHQAFHTAIAAGCRSPHLLQARAALFDQAERYRHLWLCRTVFSDDALDAKRREHAALVEAILARDTPRARAMMRDHLMTPVPIIRQELEARALI